MKSPAAALVCVGALTRPAWAQVHLGPEDCVSLSRSSAGTCVLATSCQGVDTTHFDFAFTCRDAEGGAKRHSFGQGGFDDVEEFDTGVACSACEAPPAKKRHATRRVKAAAKKASKTTKTMAAQPVTVKAPVAVKKATPVKVQAVAAPPVKVQAVAAPPVALAAAAAEVSDYGPGDCVSTWRNVSTGHCVMQTKCSQQNMDGYEYSLVCVDQTGEPVKHLFGKNSFDPEETFDTLIVCEECVGTEDYVPKDVAYTLGALGAEVTQMQASLENATNVVSNIAAKVFNAPFPAPTPAPTPTNLAPAPNFGPAPPPAPPYQGFPPGSGTLLLSHQRAAGARKAPHHRHPRAVAEAERDDEDDGDTDEAESEEEAPEDDSPSSDSPDE